MPTKILQKFSQKKGKEECRLTLQPLSAVRIIQLDNNLSNCPVILNITRGFEDPNFKDLVLKNPDFEEKKSVENSE